MLSPDQIKARDGKLTASRVACLMTGDEEKILNLWRELVGDPAFEGEDLSGVWAVQLGSHTESLNLDWYERRTGKPLTQRGCVVQHPTIGWAAATLDAWDDDLGAPVEAKHVGGFEKIATVLERYAPQAHWQMIVTGARRCVFTVIEGAREPVIEVVEYDEAYGHELLTRATQFMACVAAMIEPIASEPVAAPAKPEKIYDMAGSNEWAANAATWLMTHDAAKDNAAAVKTIKGLVPADAVKCIGYGIYASRSKTGAITIREMK